MKKLLSKENFAQVLKYSLCVMCGIAVIQMLVAILPTPILCDDLFDKGKKIISNAQIELVEFSMALFPIALIFDIFCVYFTRDERKMAWYLKLGIIITVATALILIVNSGVVIDTIKQWFS